MPASYLFVMFGHDISIEAIRMLVAIRIAPRNECMSQNETVTEAKNAEKIAQIFLVPADEQGQPRFDEIIPIYEARQLNNVLSPVMPLYDLQCACALIPIKLSGLMKILGRHKSKFAPRYRFRYKANGARIRERLLSAAEIQHIRGLTLHGPGKDILKILS